MQKDIYLRKVDWSDRDLIFRWSNDKDVRLNSFRVEQIEYESHLVWFRKELNSNNDYYILVDSGRNIGQIRGDRKQDSIIITYDVDVGERGKGYGKTMMQLYERQHSDDHGIALVAYVKKTNCCSKEVFTKLRYKEESNHQGFVKFVKWL